MSEVDASNTRMMMSFWDGGRCHFTRTMALAEEAVHRGIEVGVVTSEKYAQEIGSLGLASEVYVIPTRPAVTTPPPYEFPLYSHAFRHAQRLRGLGFYDVEWVYDTTQKEIEAMKHFKPNVVVNDYRDTIRTSAQVYGVPVVGVAHTTGSVDGLPFSWWSPPPDDAILPDCKDSFNKVRTHFGLEPIVDEREMFSGDRTLIPSSPSLDPLAKESGNTFHVGMLSRWKSDKNFVPIDSRLAGARVFSYTGEPTRPQYGFETMIQEVMTQSSEQGFYVVGDSARYASAEIARRQQEGTAVVAGFIPGPDAIADSSVTLCHGGNGTIMLSLTLGKPIICIGPYQSDCSSTFWGVQDQGAGIMLNHSTGPLARKLAPDLGEGVEIFGYWKTELTADGIRVAINEVLEDDSYTVNATRLGEELIELGGVSRAVDLIQEMM